MGKNDISSLTHLTCAKCDSYFVAMVLVMGRGVSSVGMVTDLSFEDARRLYRTEPFTTDEMIEAHKFIQEKLFINSLILNR